MNRGFSSAMNVCVLVVFLMSLCFFCSCKKSGEEAAAPPKPADTNEVSAAQPPPEVKVEVNEPTRAEVNEPAPKTPDETETADETKVRDETKGTEDANTPDVAVNVPAGWVAIHPDLPKRMFVGTPQDTRVPNLEKPLGKARGPFFAPAGTKNVAAGKPVSSSDEEPIIGDIDMITDGDKEAADGSYVELGPFDQHVTVDLEAVHEIYAILAWHYHKQARVYFDVVVQVADDPDFISNVKTLFNNDIDNSLGLGVGKDMHYTETNEGKLFDAKGVKARYVRLYSKGNTSNDLNHYIEVEVFGRPLGGTEAPEETKAPEDANTADVAVNVPAGWVAIHPELPKPMFVGTPQDTRVPNLEKPRGKARGDFFAPAGTKNLAAGKPVSSSDEEPIIGDIDMITDGDKEAADGSYVELGPFDQHVTVDLEAVHEIYAILAWHYHKQARVYFDVVVQVADDPDFISNVKTLFNNDIDNSLGLGVGKDMHYTETNEGRLFDAKGVKGRYVRLYSKGNTSNDLNHYIEVEVYGRPVE